jgi:hypothetical protein
MGMSMPDRKTPPAIPAASADAAAVPGAAAAVPPRLPEFGGPEGPEPTRFGDWEKNGRCIDF